MSVGYGGRQELRRQRVTWGHGVAYAPDGRTLATADYGGMLLSTRDPQGTPRFAVDDGPVMSLVFSPMARPCVLTQNNACV